MIVLKLVLGSLVLCFSACQPPPPPILPTCAPVPTPVCIPSLFDKTLLDTAMPTPGHLYAHIALLPRPMNSMADDNAISFVPARSGGLAAVVSSDRRISPEMDLHSVQRMWSARFQGVLSYNDFECVQEESAPLPCGAGTYCAADGRYYFTAKAENDDPDDFDLYSSAISWIGDTMHLIKVERLPTVNNEHRFDAQPALTPDGKVLYFVSDRGEGEGGTDIWYSVRASAQSNAWSLPLPLPSPINTPCDEISPCVSKDGKTLYFSSNGHATVGGYDIFKCERIEAAGMDEATAWSEPKNLGMPINTEYDEVFPYSLNDTAFFYCSNQPSDIGGRNLYTISYSRVPFGQGQTVVNAPHKHVDSVAIRDSIFKALANVPVRVQGHVEQTHHDSTELFVNDPATEKQLAEKKLGHSGDFQLLLNRGKQYAVGVKNETSFYDMKRIDLRNSIDTTMNLSFTLPDTLVLHINFPFDNHDKPYEFIMSDSGTQLDVSWEHSLDLVAKSVEGSTKRLRSLVLIGYTDSLGTDAYNQQLGLDRATFVEQELVKRGVPKQLMRVESRGRTLPAVKRAGESDEIYRLRCRRVEFVKVFKKE